jgi:PAS domain S-box-containing protein
VSGTHLRRGQAEASGAARIPPADVERVALAMEGSGKAVIATDPEGRIVFWNDEARSLYGWSADEVLGRDVVQVTPSELSQRDAARIMTALRQGESWSGRFIVRDKEGHRFLAEVADVPVHDASGALTGVVGISQRVEYLHG